MAKIGKGSNQSNKGNNKPQETAAQPPPPAAVTPDAPKAPEPQPAKVTRLTMEQVEKAIAGQHAPEQAPAVDASNGAPAQEQATATDKAAKAREAKAANAKLRQQVQEAFAALALKDKLIAKLTADMAAYADESVAWAHQAQRHGQLDVEGSVGYLCACISDAFNGVAGGQGSEPATIGDVLEIMRDLPVDFAIVGEPRPAGGERKRTPGVQGVQYEVGDIVDIKLEFAAANDITPEEAVGLRVMVVRGKEASVGLFHKPEDARPAFRFTVPLKDLNLVRKAKPAEAPAPEAAAS